MPAVIVWTASAYAIVGGTLTLIGWTFDLPRLTDWGNDGISMFVNTALCVTCCGLALLFLVPFRGTPRGAAARAAASVVALIGTLTIVEHITGWNLGIDTFLIDRPWGQRAATSAMRMGPPASMSFAVLGAAIFLATFGFRARRAASRLAILPVAIASLSLTGYWFEADQLFGIARFTGIAWQTSTILLVLGIATMAAIPEQGIAAALRRDDMGGAVLRQLMVPIVLIPFARAR